MKPRKMIVVPAAALLILTAAGCGGGVGTPTSTTSATTTSTTSVTTAPQTTASQSTVTADEYDVYSALIQSVYIGATQPKQIVITPVHDDNHFFGQAADVMESWWPDLGVEIVDDFKAKNETSSVLERRFTLSVPYTIVSEQEMASIFSTTVSGWKKFYAKYPDAKAFLALSRVGFNQEKDTAVLYTQYQRGPTGGQGDVVLMKKTDGRWTVEQDGMFWTS
jgi:hypothetical protein